MREIILDTETTGLNLQSDRIVEIGCVEMISGVPSGEVYQTYINPTRSVPMAAFAVHGLSWQFLKHFPTFDEVCANFLSFIGDARLVIHNAKFDLGFLNAEMQRCKLPPMSMSAERVVDTLDLARKLYPGQQAGLDALCRRLGIDNSRRTQHGALLDAKILADVYMQLTGGLQQNMALQTPAGPKTATERQPQQSQVSRNDQLPRVVVSAQEDVDHRTFLAQNGL